MHIITPCFCHRNGNTPGSLIEEVCQNEANRNRYGIEKKLHGAEAAGTFHS